MTIITRDAKLLEGKAPWVNPDTLPKPPWWHKLIVCNDDCDNCPLNTAEGCARGCYRYPDNVCEGCPCRASKHAPKEINGGDK